MGVDGILTYMYDFNDCGEYIAPGAIPEVGPMRPTSDNVGVKPRSLFYYLNHGPLAYTTRADHRDIVGRILPKGSKVLASRRGRVLTFVADVGTVVLDGDRWSVVGAPTMSYMDSAIALCA